MTLWEKLADVTFQEHPIRRYREVKDWIAHDLVTYADAIMLDEDAPVVLEMRYARQRANRGRAAELEVAAKNLPAWYRKWLHRCGEEPFKAAKNLRELADATMREGADRHVANIKRWLRL